MSVVTVENHTGLPHLLYEKTTPAGVPMDVLVLKGSFDMPQRGVMPRSSRQSKIRYGDAHLGAEGAMPLSAVLLYEGDLVLEKPSSDIQVIGHLRSLEHDPSSSWLAELRVGTLEKQLLAVGPRQFEKNPLGWKLTKPERMTQVALDYRLAFGGSFYEPSENDQPQAVAYPSNPAGCGWLPDSQDFAPLEQGCRERIEQRISNLKHFAAPQFESPERRLADPFQRLQPEGFGPIARWWQPRIALAGTLDAKWMAERYPLLPDDFDSRFYQSAHPHLITAQYLQGDEPVSLKGCFAEGAAHVQLPGLQPVVVVTLHTGRQQLLAPVLDTLRLDLDQRRATLLWRIAITGQEVRQLEVSLVGVQHWHQTQHMMGGQV